MIVRSAGLVAAVALLASCTSQSHEGGRPQGGGSQRDCFFPSQISGFNVIGRDRVRVNVGPGRSFEFQTFGPCPDLGWSENLGFDPRGPGTICRGMDVDLIVPSPIGPRRCRVSMIRRIEPNEQQQPEPREQPQPQQQQEQPPQPAQPQQY